MEVPLCIWNYSNNDRARAFNIELYTQEYNTTYLDKVREDKNKMCEWNESSEIAWRDCTNGRNGDSPNLVSQMHFLITKYTLDFEMLTECILCTLFGLLYIAAHKRNDSQGGIMEEIEYTEENLHEQIPEFKIYGNMMCVCFWTYMLLHQQLYYVIVSTMFTFQTKSNIKKVALQRTITMFLLLRTNKYIKHNKIYLIGCITIYMYVLFTGIVTLRLHQGIALYSSDAGKNYIDILIIVQIICDILLVIGHVGDRESTFMVIYNCRMTYMALSTLSLNVCMALAHIPRHVKMCSDAATLSYRVL